MITAKKEGVLLSYQPSEFDDADTVEKGQKHQQRTEPAQCHAPEDAGSQQITAVFATCDILAFGVYNYAAKNNLRIPEDLAVLGFGNNNFSTCFETAP